MNRQVIKVLLTAALMAGVVGWFAWWQHRPSAAVQVEESGPESTVWRMMEASAAADSEAYLACYTGEVELALRRNVQEMGAEQFRAYLAKIHGETKGIAVAPPELVSPTEARVRIEYVYADRNEIQQVCLRQVGEEWRIFRVDGAQPMKALVPYGTPVAE